MFNLVTNPAEQHNNVTLKQSPEANQLIETSPVLFDLRSLKVDNLSFTLHPYKFSWWSVHSPIT
jgi:hypothetical protein